MQVRFHTTMFDSVNFDSASVVGNSIIITLKTDEEKVVDFKNQKSAHEAMIELELTIYNANNGTYTPEGSTRSLFDTIKNNSKVKGFISSLTAQVDALKDAASDAAVESVKTVAKEKANNFFTKVKVEVEKTKANVEDFVQKNKNVAPADEVVEKVQPKEKVQSEKPAKENRITRDIPPRKSLLDDADIFGTSRGIQPTVVPVTVVVVDAPAGVLDPSLYDETIIASLSDEELKAVLNYEIDKSVSTSKVQSMIETQGMGTSDVNSLIDLYKELIFQAARDHDEYTVGDLIRELLR